MRQAIRALGWATNIFLIILLLFTGTVIYSALQIRPSFGEPSLHASSDVLIVSLHLGLNNRGFYDISKFNITTSVRDINGSAISDSSTFVPLISGGSNASITHNMTISLVSITTDDLSYLLFNDSELTVDAILKLTYASAFPFEISGNFSIPWGAPLANLTLESVSIVPFNSTHVRAVALLSFENHSYFEMDGNVRIEIVDTADQIVGRDSTGFHAPSGSRVDASFSTFLTGGGVGLKEARLFFDTLFFDYGPVVIPLV